MTVAKSIGAHVVLFADIPAGTREDIHLFEKFVKATIEYYKRIYDTPRRVWVNGKDVPSDMDIIVEGLRVEKRNGCTRGKIMVM